MNPGDYAFGFRCEEDESASSLQIHPLRGAPANRYGRISWAAPPSSKIIGVSGEARLRNDSGQQARLSFLDSRGIEVGRIATGSDSPGGFEPFARQLSDGGRDRFAASLVCAGAGRVPEHRPGPDLDPLGAADDQRRRRPGRLPRWVADRVRDGIAAAGGLSVFSGDFGSGIRRLDVSVNGGAVARRPSRSPAR